MNVVGFPAAAVMACLLLPATATASAARCGSPLRIAWPSDRAPLSANVHGQASGPGADYLALLAAQRPLLPQPLRWWMGAQALRLNARLARHLAGQPLRGLQALPQAWQEPARAAALMAADGFHPNPAGYALWAEVLAEHLAATRVTGLSQTR